MSRPSRTTTAILFAITALNFAGCKTIYSDTYAWKRNHFKPLKETSKEKDLLPPSLTTPTPSSELPPPLPGGVPPAPAPAMPDAAPAPAPAVPGL
jgi:hypothetical protein